MLKAFIRQGFLALFLAVPCLTVSAQTTTPTNAERDRAKFGHFFEPVLLDPRLTTGRLLDAAMPLTDVTVYTGTENGGGVVSGNIPMAQRGGPIQPSADADAWRAAYATLLTGSVLDQRRTPLTDLHEINTRINDQPQVLYDDRARTEPLVDLLLAYVPYQRLRADAYDRNLLRLSTLTLAVPDTQLVPVAGAASPFYPATAFLAAPSRTVAYGQSVLFHYQPNLFFINGSSQQFTSLKVDFGDGGGIRTLAPGSITRITYSAQGVAALHFVLTDAAGGTVHAYGHLNVVFQLVNYRPDNTQSTGYDAGSGGNNRAYHFPLNDPLFLYRESFPDPDATYGPVAKAGLSIFSPPTQSSPTITHHVEVIDGATVTVSYGGDRNIGAQPGIAPLFRKPILIIEGFDSWKFDGTPNYSFWSFLNEEVRGISEIIFEKSTPTVPEVNFSKKLANSNYDLIFVDFENGSADIRHNSMIVANVIEWVKAHYDHGSGSPVTMHYDPASNQQVPDEEFKLTVIGQSMGGLIGRFALGYLDHGTVAAHNPLSATATAHPGVTAFVKLLVTRDSPHQGANTPAGLQIAVQKLAETSMGRFAIVSPLAWPFANQTLGEVSSRLGNAYRLLDEPAALQLILYKDRYTPHMVVPGTFTLPGGPIPLPFGTNAGNNFRAVHYRPMIDYPSGVTPAYRTAALSNGSECGTLQPYPAHSELARCESHLYVNPIMVVPIAALGAVAAPAGVGFLIAAVAAAVATVSGKDLDTEVIINTLPDPSQGSQRIFHAKIRMRIEIFPLVHFWILKKFYIPIRLLESDANSIAEMPNYDNAPGGYYLNDLKFDVPALANSHGASFFIDNTTSFGSQPEFGFVPTASAIDYNASSTVNFAGQTMLDQATLTRSYPDDGIPGALSRLGPFAAQEPSTDVALHQANSRHIQFTTRSARFVFGLMTGQVLPNVVCRPNCNVTGVSISGASNICAGGETYTATVAGGTGSTALHWLCLSPTIQIDGPDDQPTVRVIRTPNASGAGVTSVSNVLKLEVMESCKAYDPAVMTVSTLDAPRVPGPLVNQRPTNTTICCPAQMGYVAPVPGAVSYQWVSSNEYYIASGQGPVPFEWFFNACSGDLNAGQRTSFTVTLTATGNCGAHPTTQKTYTFNVKRPPAGSGPNGCTQRPAPTDSTGITPVADEPIKAYPNSSDGQFLAELQQDSIGWSDDPTLLTEFKMYDLYGQERVSKTETDGNADIPTQNLPEGPYILRVRRGTRQEMMRISVDH